MKRIGPIAIIISSTELRTYGWTFAQQVSRNPSAKEAAPDLRSERAGELYKVRTNQHLARFKHSRDIAHIRHALHTRSKEGL